MNYFSKYDGVSAVVISAPHAEQASSMCAVTCILCFIIQLSAEKFLSGCFWDALMKTKTDIKEGIKQAPLCGYSTMNDLFRFGCLHLSQWQRQTDNKWQCLYVENTQIRILSASSAVCVFLCVVYLISDRHHPEGNSNTSATWIFIQGHGVCGGW